MNHEILSETANYIPEKHIRIYSQQIPFKATTHTGENGNGILPW
jgi:hypothetical protein